MQRACDQAFRSCFHCGLVQHNGILGPVRDTAQNLARFVVIAVPEQVPKSHDIDLGLVEQGERCRLEGAQASHDLLEAVHAHGKMEPVKMGSTGLPVAERTSAGNAGSPSLIAVTAWPCGPPWSSSVARSKKWGCPA